mmetsp:Transcript_34540/g.104216  ORF Transcript_34540/g.104216 Transcript_34540/m.104216 type:complete len:242 (+) Transcript_34540:320-1045(+)
MWYGSVTAMCAKTTLRPNGDCTASNTRGFDNFELISKANSLEATTQKMFDKTKRPRDSQSRPARDPWWASDMALLDNNTAVAKYHIRVASLAALSKDAGNRNMPPNSPMRSKAAACNLIVFQLASKDVAAIEATCTANNHGCDSDCWIDERSKSTFAHRTPHFSATRVRKCRSMGRHQKHEAPRQPARSRHRSVSRLARPTHRESEDMARVMFRRARRSPSCTIQSSFQSTEKCMCDHIGP